MQVGLVIYGSLNTLSGGYMYDRMLVEYLRAQGDSVEIISLPWRNYASHLSDNFKFKLPPGVDILIQDGLTIIRWSPIPGHIPIPSFRLSITCAAPNCVRNGRITCIA